MPETPKWITKAKETFRYHREMVMTHDKWTIEQTAKNLKRSQGSISEDILIARWCKDNEKRLERFDYIYEALDWIREKKKEIAMKEIE